jgi:exopolysaccharide biosynthesis protein
MKRIKYLVISAAVLWGCSTDSFEQPGYYSTDASSPLGKAIVEASAGYVAHIQEESEVKLSRGATLLKMAYTNMDGHAMRLFLFKAVLGPVSVRMTLPGDTDATGSLQKLSEQASAIENHSVWTVYGAVSGGAFSSSGQPSGILYHNGKSLGKESAEDLPFFAVLADGQAVCGDGTGFAEISYKVSEAVSGGPMLLQGGYVLAQANVTSDARAAVGVGSDGNEVYLMVVDGGDFFYSNGITCSDMALLMKGCGATEAMVLDSGSPVTAIWRNERRIELFELLNKPSDRGVEAEICDGIAIVQR